MPPGATDGPTASPTEGPDSTHVGSTGGPGDLPIGALLIAGSLGSAVLILLFGIGRRRRDHTVNRIPRRS